MRDTMSEIMDLALTQAIERYRDMRPGEAYQAIADEWPQQIAILLIEFFFKTTCGMDVEMPPLMFIERDNSNNPYAVLVCRCAWNGVR